MQPDMSVLVFAQTYPRMIRNYLVVAFRNISRNRLFSTVNIMGLAFGMASALMIFLWINDELQHDRFHVNASRIYAVMENQQYTDGKIFTFSSTPGPMAPFIREKYPEIERASRFTWEVSNLFSYEQKSFYEPGRYVDPDFLEMFSFRFVQGDLHTALNDKNSIVISSAMAKKYFGDDVPLGKLLVMNTKNSFVVTGVFKDVPHRSSLRFQYLLPFQVFWDENINWLDEWDNNNIRTFIMLREDADRINFSDKLKHEIRAHVATTNVELFIHPLTEMYLHGDFENGIQSGGRIEYVRTFFVVAVFVLFIACINFMNLATAQATKRAKEVGLRKVIGAAPRQLFRQFMGESLLTVCISGVVSIFLIILMIPYFNDLTGKVLGLDLLDVRLVAGFTAILLFTAFAAGSYPAIFISEFRPVEVLKGQLKSGSRAAVLRKSLVVLQFTLSIILIISTAVVFRQMEFMQDKDIGFDRENLFYLWMEGDVNRNLETFRTRLLAEEGIESVTAAGHLPIDIGNSTSQVDWAGKDSDERILFTTLNADYNFVQSMKMEMVEGRPFDSSLVTDSANYIVNEEAAAKLGFKGGTAGQDLSLWEKKGKIVGVVRDFNFGSLHNPIEPLIIHIQPKYFYCLLVRGKQRESEAALRSAEKLWKEYAAGYPFRYSFLNQDWEQFYKAEAQRGKIFNALAALSIFISCLGLFGLSAFSAKRRTKELGIRKVLGATVPGLVQLMNMEFAWLVVISAGIGCPVGWYVMNTWLQKYAYHVDVGYATLAIAAGICLVIAVLTVSYHAIRAAAANPARSLRYE